MQVCDIAGDVAGDVDIVQRLVCVCVCVCVCVHVCAHECCFVCLTDGWFQESGFFFFSLDEDPKTSELDNICFESIYSFDMHSDKDYLNLSQSKP